MAAFVAIADTPTPRYLGELGTALCAAKQKQNQKDQDHQAETAAWIVAPASAMAPGWESANGHKDENN